MEPTRAYLIALGTALVVMGSRAEAQLRAAARPEARFDVLASRAPAAQLGVGVMYPLGTYVRLGTVVAGGLASHHSETVAAGRADLITHFVLDPYGESRWALYGIAGLSGVYDGFERWRALAMVGIGIEGRYRAPIAPAFELSLGGGIRIGAAIRWVRGDLR